MRKLVAALAIAFFFLPTALWVVGVRANAFENRRMASAPALSDGWDAFDGATRFFVDRLPLREQAVRANTWTSVNIFGTTPDYSRAQAHDALPFGQPDEPAEPEPVKPSVTVLEGRDGWLFLVDELARACTSFIAWPEAVKRFERFVRIIRDSGRRVVLAVPPDKSTIYPEYLPDAFAQKDCYAGGREAAWAAIENSNQPDVLGLRRTMLATKAPPPEETYFPLDSHWNTKGALIAARAVLAALGGRVQMFDGEIQKGRANYNGDLATLRGAPEVGEAPAWTIVRPVARGERTKEKLRRSQVTVDRRVAGGAPMLAGRTLFVHDSYGDKMRDALSPYMRELASLPWYRTPAEDLIDAIAGARTVILQKVERDLNYYGSDQGLVTPAFLNRLEAQLKAG